MQEMDMHMEKLKLIEWLARLNDLSVLQEFLDLKKSKEIDWWDSISEEEKAEILEGLYQAEKGDLTPHKEAMVKYDICR